MVLSLLSTTQHVAARWDNIWQFVAGNGLEYYRGLTHQILYVWNLSSLTMSWVARFIAEWAAPTERTGLTRAKSTWLGPIHAEKQSHLLSVLLLHLTLSCNELTETLLFPNRGQHLTHTTLYVAYCFFPLLRNANTLTVLKQEGF
jgi:hypothetical protein